MSWLYQYTLFHKPSYKTLLSEQNWSFCATVNVCGFTHSNILAVFTDYFDTPVSWDKRFKDSCRHGCEHTPLLSHVSAGRTPNDHFSIFFKMESLFPNLFISWYIVDLQGTERTRNQFTNLLWYSYRISSSLSFPIRNPLYQLQWKKKKKIVDSFTMKGLFVACVYIFKPHWNLHLTSNKWKWTVTKYSLIYCTQICSDKTTRNMSHRAL
jgi:hypothetical protein